MSISITIPFEERDWASGYNIYIGTKTISITVSDYQPLEITWEEPIVTTKTSKQIALEAANEIADHFSDGFFDDGMVKDATDIINKHFSKLKDNQHEL